MRSNQRLLFIRYSDYEKQNLKKLTKVSDRIYVFLDPEQTQIPLDSVVRAQELCSVVTWIDLYTDTNEELIQYMSFYLGQEHVKQSLSTEFAIYNHNEEMDVVISHLNEQGRKCIRIKADAPEIDQTPDLLINLSSPSVESRSDDPIYQDDEEVESDEILSGRILSTTLKREKTIIKSSAKSLARKTLNRLIESGNRPAQVSTLKSYILLNNQEENITDRIDDILSQLNSFDEIDIIEDHVIYNLD